VNLLAYYINLCQQRPSLKSNIQEPFAFLRNKSLNKKYTVLKNTNAQDNFFGGYEQCKFDYNQQWEDFIKTNWKTSSQWFAIGNGVAKSCSKASFVNGMKSFHFDSKIFVLSEA
jgi:hypothetical protein